jgi:dTDP-4-dehydrorhamnose reductase
LDKQDEKKILVTGASGLLGHKFVEQTMERFAGYKIIPTHRTRSLFFHSVRMDITNERSVLRIFEKFRPNVVVHTAAETNVDRCEIEKKHALKVNAEGTKIVAEACRRVGAKIVYISTDYVFNGEKGLYTEEDEAYPVNNYGFSKFKGENYVAELCPNYLIVRSSVLFGWHTWKLNFVTWVINSLKRGKQIQVVDDHFNSPTLADNLAEALLEVIRKDLKGLYHIAGRERINRFEFALKIAESFDLEENLIKPIKMDQLKVWVAKRPRDSSLCVDKVRKKLKVKLLNIEESLDKMRKEAKNERNHSARWSWDKA